VKVLRYPVRSLIGDYLRAASGLGVGAVVLVSVPSDSMAVVVIFGAIAVLFAVFGLRTVQRHITEVALSKKGIACRAFRLRTIFWQDLDRLKLRFYGTRRRSSQDRSNFLELTLAGGGTSLSFESSIEGFELIVWRAAKAARENAVSLDPTSAGNLLGIGIDADEDTPPPEGLEPEDL
jgi:hypothetical protein